MSYLTIEKVPTIPGVPVTAWKICIDGQQAGETFASKQEGWKRVEGLRRSSRITYEGGEALISQINVDASIPHSAKADPLGDLIRGTVEL